MALNFPANPQLNDTYTSGGVTWEYDGVAWNIQPVEKSVFTNFDADTGSATPTTPDDTLTIAGGTNITTSISGKTLTINSDVQGGATQNLFETVTSDDGSVTAASPTATLNVLGGTNIATEIATDTNNVVINMSTFSIDFLTDVDTSSTPPVAGNVLKWDGNHWAPGADATTGGGGTDADTLDGFDSSYFLNYNNLSNRPAIATLTDFSVGNERTASGNGAIEYDNTTGVFRYTPPTAAGLGALTAEVNDLTAAVTWANVPDANITQSSVTQHQAALSITESQISDLGNYLTSVSASDLNSISIDALSDVDTTTSAPTNGQILAWNGSNWAPSAAGAGGDVNQNAFSNVAVSGQGTVEADTTTDTLTLIAGTGISLTTNTVNDSVTISSTVSAGPTEFDNLTDVQSSGINISQIYEPAIAMLRVGAVGVTAYTFNSHYTGNNPTIYALAGTTIAFDLTNASGHPFQIQDGTGANYNTGLVHVETDGTIRTGSNAQQQQGGTLYWRIPESISGGYRYQCSSHPAMVGAITIKRLSVI